MKNSALYSSMLVRVLLFVLVLLCRRFVRVVFGFVLWFALGVIEEKFPPVSVNLTLCQRSEGSIKTPFSKYSFKSRFASVYP